ncbi:hypothetical protein EAKF1_ch3345 [Escherichia albertii KF1]|nr:hypothetical protein EAKF1_ch3345 [Escherichia albertii KF1]
MPFLKSDRQAVTKLDNKVALSISVTRPELPATLPFYCLAHRKDRKRTA